MERHPAAQPPLRSPSEGPASAIRRQAWFLGKRVRATAASKSRANDEQRREREGISPALISPCGISRPERLQPVGRNKRSALRRTGVMLPHAELSPRLRARRMLVLHRQSVGPVTPSADGPYRRVARGDAARPDAPPVFHQRPQIPSAVESRLQPAQCALVIATRCHTPPKSLPGCIQLNSRIEHRHVLLVV
jgi:hypothetical protein